MATQYPSNIDTTGTLPYVVDGVTPILGSNVNTLRDAIVAIETELGPNPSGGTSTTVSDRIGVLEGVVAGFAPEAASYLVLGGSISLSNERIFSIGTGLVGIDSGADSTYTIELGHSGVVAGVYPSSGVSVDGYGRITNVSSSVNAATAGVYPFAEITIDGYGRITDITSGATGQANTLPYWVDADTLSYDGYVHVFGDGRLSLSRPQNAPTKIIVANESTGSSASSVLELLSFDGYGVRLSSFPDGYSGFGFSFNEHSGFLESDTTLVLSARPGPVYAGTVYLASNFLGLLGKNSSPWASVEIQEDTINVKNKYSSNLYSSASMNPSLSALSVWGRITLGTTAVDDGYGVSIETTDDLAIAALGPELMIMSNYATASNIATVSVGAIDGNGPQNNSAWVDRFHASAGHVKKIAEFTYDSIAGKSQMILGATSSLAQLLLGTGTGALPAYSFVGNSGSGLSSSPGGMIVSADGYTVAVIDKEYLTTLNLGSMTNGVANIKLAEGTESFPAYGFFPDITSGLYRSAADQMAISTLGVKRAHVDANSLTTTVPVLVSSGSSSAPSHGFSAETNTGFFRSEAGSIGMALLGNVSRSVSATLTTTNDTTTTIMSISTSSNRAYHINYRLVARSTAGSNDNAVLTGTVRAINKAGVLTVEKTEFAADSDTTLAGWPVAGSILTVTTSSTTILIQVDGPESPGGDTDWLIFADILTV
jgi:hypothetical protein